jgi:hypothetical protein
MFDLFFSLFVGFSCCSSHHTTGGCTKTPSTPTTPTTPSGPIQSAA